MMFTDLLANYVIFLIVTFGFVSCIFTISLIWFRFPSRTIDDVIGYLRPVDLEAARSLMDPVLEGCLRRDLSATEFRSTQRKRTLLYIEIMKRMFHNAGILVEWASTESGRMNGETLGPAQHVHHEAVQVRAFTLFTIIKLRVWLVMKVYSWRIFPAPSLAGTHDSGGVEALEGYDRLKTAATYLFLKLKGERLEELTQAL